MTTDVNTPNTTPNTTRRNVRAGGLNGRSGGYLVLYQGGMDYKNAKTAQCDVCGKLTWHKKDAPRCPKEEYRGA